MITEHRYTLKYDQSSSSGKYCVQFMVFKNTEEGMKVLNWWRNACIDWCYARHEDGKFGDQKYLDNWTKMFEGVHELHHLGGGLAPWNIQQYEFTISNGKISGKELSTGKVFEPVFFHYHSLKFFENDIVVLSDTEYDLSKNVIDVFYRDYVKQLMQQYRIVKKENNAINANGVFSKSPFNPMSFGTVLQYYRQNLRASKRNLLGKKLIRQIRNHYFHYTSEFE
jgi:hypothetical protein